MFEFIREFFRPPLLVAISSVVLFVFALSLGGQRVYPQEDIQNKQPFTVVVLPDTQNYSMSNPEIYEAQTQWIVSQKSKRNIVFVSHLGDIVQQTDVESEWQAASKAMALLEGKVPYGIAPGNHDMLENGAAPLFTKYFPPARLKEAGSTGTFSRQGTADIKNSYRLLSAGEGKYIAFNLEFCPPDDVLAWVSGLLRSHPDHQAIIATHYFVNFKGERTDRSDCLAFSHEGTNGGIQVWDKLIVQDGHTNILLFLNGHDIWTHNGAARRTDRVGGKPVHQLLSDYQHLGQGGDGYLRIMTFIPSEKTIKVETYSPYLDKYLTTPENKFELSLE